MTDPHPEFTRLRLFLPSGRRVRTPSPYRSTTSDVATTARYYVEETMSDELEDDSVEEGVYTVLLRDPAGNDWSVKVTVVREPRLYAERAEPAPPSQKPRGGEGG